MHLSSARLTAQHRGAARHYARLGLVAGHIERVQRSRSAGVGLRVQVAVASRVKLTEMWPAREATSLGPAPAALRPGSDTTVTGEPAQPFPPWHR